MLTPLEEDAGPANQERGEFDFVVKSGRYRLRVGMNMLVRLEGVLPEGETAVIVQTRLMKGGETMVDYVNLFWAMLGEFHPGVTQIEVGDLCDEIAKLGSAQLQSVLTQALNASTPEPSEQDPRRRSAKKTKAKKVRRAGGTGKGSIATRAGSGSTAKSSGR